MAVVAVVAVVVQLPRVLVPHRVRLRLVLVEVAEVAVVAAVVAVAFKR